MPGELEKRAFSGAEPDWVTATSSLEDPARTFPKTVVFDTGTIAPDVAMPSTPESCLETGLEINVSELLACC